MCTESLLLSSPRQRRIAIRATCTAHLETFRSFLCARCHRPVQVCTWCDRGQIYCSDECASECRRESIRRAGDVYQKSPHGRLRHAARQQRYRDRRLQIVTHHGSGASPDGPTQEAEEVEAERVAATAAGAVGPDGEASGNTTTDVVTPLDDAPMPEFGSSGLTGPAFSLPAERMGGCRCTFCGRLCGHFSRRSFLHGRSYGFS